MGIEKDVVYAAPGGRELKLDLYRPEGGSVPTRTAVVLVHGGAWMLGERGMVTPLASALAQQGFLAVPVEYRLVREAAWPAQCDDVVAAIEWLAAHAAKLGIDADRIVVGGGSAGGHLALMAAVQLGRAKVAAVLSLFPASELTVDQPAPRGMFGAAQLVGPDASPEALRAASPLHRITADFPPVFLLHGGGDWLIDPQASLNLYHRLRELGVSAELHIVAEALHEFAEEPGLCEAMVAEMALFLRRIVIEPEHWRANTAAHNLFAKGPEAIMAMMQDLLAQQ